MLLIGALLPYLARRSFARWMADGGIFGSTVSLENGERRGRWIVQIVGAEASLVILIGLVRLFFGSYESIRMLEKHGAKSGVWIGE